MMNISSIKLHMYCPMKLYIKTHVDMNETEDYRLFIEIKKLKIDIQDLIQKNMRKVKKDMDLAEIENILSENIDPYIESTTKAIKSMDLGLENTQIKEIMDNTYFNIKTTALKTKQSMTILDKIEIIDGKYYPVTLKSTNPPIKGIWDQDAIELVACAILLEEEFETEVYVGFVDYEKIGDRRPVVMDVNLRKALFNVMHEVKEIIDNKKLPKVKKSIKKCEKCEYKEICIKE